MNNYLLYFLLNALQASTDCIKGLEICVFLTRITGYFFLFDNIVLMLYYIMLFHNVLHIVLYFGIFYYNYMKYVR